MNHFYAGKRVVVTGGAGFLGYHLVKKLLATGASITVLDNFSRGNNRIDGVKYFEGDASNISVLEYVFKDTFAVFNLAAAVAGVIHNQQNQLEMFSENVKLQTVPVLVAGYCDVPHFLQVSSVCVYADGFTNPCMDSVPVGRMDEPVAANEGYSYSKRMGELAIKWSSIEHPVIVRPSNMYGPNDYFDERAHVIPALIKKSLNDDTLTINGTGKEVREFVYIDDVADGMIYALRHGVSKNVYNLGTNGATKATIEYIARLIQSATKTKHKPIEYSQKYDSGDNKRWADCSKLIDLGWKPKTSLVDGLKDTVKWYRKQGN